MASQDIDLDVFDDPNTCSSCSESSSSHRTQRKSTARGKLVEIGVDKVILAILDTRFSIAHEEFTILGTIGQQFGNPFELKDPAYIIVETVEREIQRYQLSLGKKRVLFSILEWEFECLACKKRKRAMHYESSSYILWGATDPIRPHLRSGPCNACKRESRHNNDGVGIIPYAVHGQKPLSDPPK